MVKGYAWPLVRARGSVTVVLLPGCNGLEGVTSSKAKRVQLPIAEPFGATVTVSRTAVKEATGSTATFFRVSWLTDPISDTEAI
jgi:hypothetical protein